MEVYKHFIAENVAPKGARDIGVYRNGEKVGRIPLGSLAPPVGKPLYSFGLLADPHAGRSAEKNAALKSAVELLTRSGVAFICIAGDIVDDGSIEKHWIDYAEAVGGAGDIPVYAINGNREQWHWDCIPEFSKEYAGIEKCVYHFHHDDDLFVMMGTWKYAQTEDAAVQAQMLPAADLIALRTLMNENRNKRCFFIQHVRPEPTLAGGNGSDAVPEQGVISMAFYQHFKNVTVFHGHSHSRLEAQEGHPKANYRDDQGFRSVHIPALVDYDQGYIVDVYCDGYHLRGMDLVANEDIPIGNFWIDTPIVGVETEY